MFHRLLESRRSVHPPTRGGFVSLSLHVAVVFALVAVTSRDRVASVEPPPEQKLVYTQRPVTPPPQIQPEMHRATRAPNAASTPVTPSVVLPVVVDIPTVLPDVDLNRPATSEADWQRRGPSGRGVTGEGILPGVAGLVSGTPFTERQVDRAVMMTPGTPGPRYPESLRAAGYEGKVLVEFVVDTVGRVEMATVSVVHADHPLFERAVREVLPKLTFLPAEYRGARVRQSVALPFEFAIRKDESGTETPRMLTPD